MPLYIYIIIIIHTHLYIYENPETGHDIINNGISGLEATAAGANEPYTPGWGVVGGSLLNIGRRLVGGHVPPNPRHRRRDRPLVTSGRPSVRPAVPPPPHGHISSAAAAPTAAAPTTSKNRFKSYSLARAHTYTHCRARMFVFRVLFICSRPISSAEPHFLSLSIPATSPAVYCAILHYYNIYIYGEQHILIRRMCSIHEYYNISNIITISSQSTDAQTRRTKRVGRFFIHTSINTHTVRLGYWPKIFSDIANTIGIIRIAI